MAVFVTVGTTSFDALIQEVNKKSFHAALYKLGYRKIFIQYGNGCTEPTKLHTSNNASPSLTDSHLLEMHTFRYHKNLNQIYNECSLIISHGGAGSCMEALSPPGKRKLIIIINDSLMHNHQEELATSLFNGGHAFVTRPIDLISFLSTGVTTIFLEKQTRIPPSPIHVNVLLGPLSKPDSVGLIPFHKDGPRALLKYLDEILGFVGA